MLYLPIVVKNSPANHLFLSYFSDKMFPNNILSRLDGLDEDTRQEIILYESLRGVSMDNFDEAFQYISKAISHKPLLISIVRKFANNGTFHYSKNALKKVFEELNIEHHLEPSEEFMLNDDINEFANWCCFNEVYGYMLKELVQWDCVKILKHLISQGFKIEKVAIDILRNGNYEMIHLLEQNYDLHNLPSYLSDTPHYDVIEWLKTNYDIDVPHPSNNLLYNFRKTDLNLAIDYDLSVCYGVFSKFKEIHYVIYWNSYKELILRDLVNILSHVKSFTTYDLYTSIETMNEEAFKIIIEKISKIDTIVPTKSYLLKTVVNSGNITFVRMVSEKLKEQLKDSFKYELLKHDSKRNTLLHTASKQSSKEVFTYVCEMIAREWSETMLLTMFYMKNSFGETPEDYLKESHDKPRWNVQRKTSKIVKGRYGKLNIKKSI